MRIKNDGRNQFHPCATRKFVPMADPEVLGNRPRKAARGGGRPAIPAGFSLFFKAPPHAGAGRSFPLLPMHAGDFHFGREEFCKMFPPKPPRQRLGASVALPNWRAPPPPYLRGLRDCSGRFRAPPKDAALLPQDNTPCAVGTPVAFYLADSSLARCANAHASLPGKWDSSRRSDRFAVLICWLL